MILFAERITGHGQSFRRDARQKDWIIVHRQQSGRAEAEVPVGTGTQEGPAGSAANRRESPHPRQHRQAIRARVLRNGRLREARHEERPRLDRGVQQTRMDRGGSGITGRSDRQSASIFNILFPCTAESSDSAFSNRASHA